MSRLPTPPYFYTQYGNFATFPHPNLPNIYGNGDVNISGDCNIEGNLTVNGSSPGAGASTSLKKNANQAILNNTYTVIDDWTLPSIGYKDNDFNLTTGELTVSGGTRVDILLRVKWDNSVDNSGVRRIRMLINGVTNYFVEDAQPFPDNAITFTQTFPIRFKAAANDIITLEVYQDSGVTINVLSDSTIYISIQ